MMNFKSVNQFWFKPLIMVLLLVPSLSFAGTEIVSTRLTGASATPVTGTYTPTLTVTDNKFTGSTGWDNGFVKDGSVLTVEFGLDEFKKQAHSSYFKTTVTFDITYKFASLTTYTITGASLEIDYNPTEGTSYKDKAILAIPDAYQATITVTGMQTVNAASTVISNVTDIYLDANIASKKYYTFDQQAIPAYSGNISKALIATTNELEVSWDVIDGAEEYELEWTYVNDYSGVFNGTISPSFTFKNDATRITTQNTYFRIPLVLERGYIVYRLRGIGYTKSSNVLYRLEGKWTSDASGLASITSVSSYPTELKYQVTGHRSDLVNWEYMASFVEEGKRGASVTYSDGAGRDRQSVSTLNTAKSVMATSTLYDFQGRPAITTLPAPIDQQKLDYVSNLNMYDDTHIYDREYFDKDGSGCTVTASPMSSTASFGAANYYSPSNPDQAGVQGLLPDAEGYPFMQVEYTPDLTGRIRRSTMPGPTHQLSATTAKHETKYYYGQPAQEDIDRLFGSEVGIANHYQRNAVIDPNGQVSISYIDMHGRVVATALSGAKPDNLDDASGSVTPHAVSEHLVKSNNVPDPNQYSYTVSKPIFVDDNNTPYSFSFSFTPNDVTFTCDPEDEVTNGLCFDCVYDLEISLKDDCGNNMFTPKKETIGKLTSGSPYNTACDQGAFSISTFTVSLDQGNYTVYKKLTVNTDPTTYYFDQFLASSDACIKTLSDFETEHYNKIDLTNCGYTCAQCTTKVNDYVTAHSGELTSPQIADLLAKCNLNCNTDSRSCDFYRKKMLKDFAPGGQYALYTISSGVASSTDPLSIFNTTSNKLLDGSGSYTYKNPPTQYKDKTGTAYASGQIDINGHLVSLSTLTAYDFISNFQTQWAEAWIEDHPEYCYLNYCETNQASQNYDKLMLQTKTYAEACSLGLLSPISGLTPPSGCSTSNRDPFFDTGGSGSAEASAMLSEIQNLCDNSSNCMDIYDRSVSLVTGSQTPITGQFGIDACLKDAEWERFKQIYISHKYKYYYKKQLDFVMSGTCKTLGYVDGGKGYNGCIGFGTGFSSTKDNFNCYPLTRTPACSATPSNYDGSSDSYNQPCSNSSYSYYINKTKHFQQNSWTDVFGFDPFSQSVSDMTDLTVTNSGTYNFADQCDKNCNAYADDWLERLKQGGCNVSLINTNAAALKAAFVAICKDGCDENNPFGTSTYNPATSTDKPTNPTYHTFQEAMTGILGTGYGDIASCNAMIIKFPKPFNHDYGASANGNTNPELDTCACNKILKTKRDFVTMQTANTLPAGVITPADLFIYLYGVGISVEELSCKCNDIFEDNNGSSWTGSSSWNSASVSALSSADVIVPSQITCHPCLPCESVTNAINTYATNHNTTDWQNNPNQAEYLTEYLNNSFNYNLTYTDYIDFYNACNASQSVSNARINIHNIHTSTENPTGYLCNDVYQHEVTVDQNECLNNMINQSKSNALFAYTQYVQELRNDFELKYKNTCYALTNEVFDMNYERREYHYTLYFYDQAGNLTRTIQPNSVGPLNATLTQNVQDHRDDPAHNSAVYLGYAPGYPFLINYKYNSFNEPLEEYNIDAGTSIYFYDKVGRIVASQNAKQAALSNHVYSYTQYDRFGRMIEVGQVTSTTTLTSTITNDDVAFSSFITGGTRTEVTQTYYDQAISASVAGNFSSGTQDNVRNRVATATHEKVYDGNSLTYDYASHFSYDDHGNVKEILQQLTPLSGTFNEFNKVEYSYDLISGKVNEVAFQRGHKEQLYHRYLYDADNRIHEVFTSRDGYVFEKDDKYFYYKHGALARTEKGDKLVQGNDFAMTIQGWVKGVNSNILKITNDPGADNKLPNTLAAIPNPHSNFASDVSGYSLHYFNDLANNIDDYKSINKASVNSDDYFIASQSNLNTSGAGFKLSDDAPSLFNGNISCMVTSIADPSAPNTGSFIPQINGCKYDQLNRIKHAKTYTGINSTTNAWNTGTTGTGYDGSYENSFTYDPNGNILTNVRKGVAAAAMDDLYYSHVLNNRLDHVEDNVSASATNIDIDNQSYGNYQYDENGSLIADAQECIASIEWTVDKKIKKITRTSSCTVNGTEPSDMEFEYDAQRNRVLKIEKPRSGGSVQTSDHWNYTYYVRDAVGNIMATYHYKPVVSGTPVFTLQEQDLYGSSRTGTVTNTGIDLTTALAIPATPTSHIFSGRTVGRKQYELTNHLGNVITTISDRKLQVSSNNQEYYDGFEDPHTNRDNTHVHQGQYASKLYTVTSGTLPASAFTPSINAEVHPGDVVNTSAWGWYSTNTPTGDASAGLLKICLMDEDGNLISIGGTPQYFRDDLNDGGGTPNQWNALTVATYTVPTVPAYAGKLYVQAYCWNPSHENAWFDDMKLSITTANNFVTYRADIRSINDQYPFGMLMPARQYNPNNYRYGFNGKENDNETKGTGNQQNYGMRIYDPRLGKFLSVDPIGFVFPWQSSYSYSLNSPNAYLDDEGLGPKNKVEQSSAHDPVETNISSGARTSVHPLAAIATSPAGPNDVLNLGLKTFRNQGVNFHQAYYVVPDQSTLWYNDFNDYDKVQLFIPNSTPPPPLICLWESGKDDKRNKDPNGKYLGTGIDKNFRDQTSDLDPHTQGLAYKGWGSYKIPKSFMGNKTDYVILTVTTHSDPNSKWHNVSIDNPFGAQRNNNSIWQFYFRGAEVPESHENVRYLGGMKQESTWDPNTDPYDPTGAVLPENIDD